MSCSLHHCMAFGLDGIETDLKAGRDTSAEFDAPLGDALQIVTPRVSDPEKWPLSPTGAYFERLDALCAEWGDRRKVRFYGHYGQVFDASALQALPNIRSLSIDSLERAINLEAIADLEHLERLHLGVFELEDKDILGKLPVKQLHGLMLSQTNTKALDLAPLAEAFNLATLYLDGHHKNIAALAHLDRLETLTFNPKRGLDLAFINGMQNLRALKFNLGGTDTIEAIELAELQDMAFTRTRDLARLGDMQRFPKLRRLLMQDQPHVESLAFGQANADLEHLWFDNCKGPSELRGLADCPQLKRLRWLFTERDPASLALPESVTHVYMLSGRSKDEATEKAAIEALGFTAAPHEEALFSYK